MVIVDASNLATNFSINSTFDGVSANSIVSATSTNYEYTSFFGNAVTLTGTGLIVDGSNFLIGGTVTSISIDLDNNESVDISITGLNLLGADIFAAAASSTDAFWELVLDGPTQIIQPSSARNFVFASDFNFVTEGSHVGGNDVFSSTGVAPEGFLTGDALVAEGTATLTGGNDSIDNAEDGSGDVIQVRGSATLTGGDDAIIFAVDMTTNGQTFITGDAFDALDSSQTTGGNDTIDLSVLVTSNGFAFGDIENADDSASITGGNDTLIGGSDRDLLVGDVRRVEDQSSLIAGDDVIQGGDGDDIIFGDYQTNTSTGQVIGGNDTLFGEGGNDELFGNEGDDTLNGGVGDDTLDGGVGDDTILGGEGLDTILGGDGADSLFGEDGNCLLYTSPSPRD